MKRKMMTRFSAGCLALLLTFGSVCSVQAAQEPAEPNTGQETQTGSVTGTADGKYESDPQWNPGSDRTK